MWNLKHGEMINAINLMKQGLTFKNYGIMDGQIVDTRKYKVASKHLSNETDHGSEDLDTEFYRVYLYPSAINPAIHPIYVSVTCKNEEKKDKRKKKKKKKMS